MSGRGIPQKEYRNIAVEKDGSVDRYIETVYETHLCKTREAAIAYIITVLDPDWDLITFAGEKDGGEP